jgi:putative ABC transport system ATP-binding protein
VAIARSLANDPLVILADEATGNLDSKSGTEILNIFDDLNRAGKTLIFVTHDERMVQRCSRVIRLRDGFLDRDEPGARPNGPPPADSARSSVTPAPSSRDEPGYLPTPALAQ